MDKDATTKNAGGNAGRSNLRPPFPKGPAAESGRPRGGRPKGSVTLSAAYRAALARRDPNDLQGRRAIAETIAESMVSAASRGAVDAAREIRMATEGDSVRIEGQVEIMYVNDWRRATPDSAEPASWDSAGALGREAVQLAARGPAVAENHNGNGAHR